MVSKSGDNEIVLGVITHVLGFFTSFIGPLIVLLAAENNKVKTHAKAALNWQLSLIIYGIVSAILIIVLVGLILLPILVLLNIIFCIVAAVKAGEGNIWAYPVSIPFFKL